MGGHLTSVRAQRRDAPVANPALPAVVPSHPQPPAAAARLASLPARLAAIAAAEGNTGDAAAEEGGSGGLSRRARKREAKLAQEAASAAAAAVSLYDFVEAADTVRRMNLSAACEGCVCVLCVCVSFPLFSNLTSLSTRQCCSNVSCSTQADQSGDGELAVLAQRAAAEGDEEATAALAAAKATLLFSGLFKGCVFFVRPLLRAFITCIHSQ